MSSVSLHPGPADSAVSPWKPCDLRGVYPASVSEDLFRRVGGAIGSELAIGQRVVVGGDFRLSTPALKVALVEGLAAAGIVVVDAGQAPTPVLYFEAQRSGAAGVFIVTASHNPGTHNGLKWMTGTYPPEPGDIHRIRANAESEVRRAGTGRIERVDPVPAYTEWMLSRWSGLSARRFGPIVLDAGNGAWSHLAPEIFRALGFEVVCLHCVPDGRFPSRSPDCARTGNLGALRAAVAWAAASLGIAWDGDGDRVAFVDEEGVHATTDEISILLLRQLLKNAAPPEHVVCDIKLSDAVRRAVLAAGGQPLLERSGHAFMRRRLLESRALLGLDACGHYFFREAGSRDDGLYSALFLLSILDGGRSLAEARRSVGPLFSTPELRLPASLLNYGAVMDRLHAAFPGAEESSVDGARLVLSDGIVLARESSTEAVVSLRIEGFNSAGYARLVDVCLGSLREGYALLRSQIAEAAQG
jgi:phosphomannomutase/phosphoglucomutase